jgi:gliding motility-associated-like protein
MIHFANRLVIFLLFLYADSALYGQSSNPVGDAYASGENCYVITANQNWQLGAVWFNELVDLDDPFDITLTVYLGNNPNGADGIVMVFQQVGTNAIGLPGGGMGFDGFSPSLGIELDTFQNTDLGDPAFDHIAIHRNGSVNHNVVNNLSGPVQAIPGNPNMADGQSHIFRVTWDPAANLLSVYLDCLLRLTYTGDIVANIFANTSEVWWGFTGATGGLSNIQSACISNYAVGLPPSLPMCQGDSVELGVVGAPDGDYSWDPPTALSDPTIANPIATPTENTTYTVTFTDLCGAETQLSTTVEIIELEVTLPEIVLACAGETITIEADGNAVDFAWSTGSNADAINITEPGAYSVTGTLGDCAATASTDVVFHPIPQVELESGYTICEGESLELTATADILSTFTWSNGSNTNSTTITQAGNYDLELVSSDDCTNSFAFTVVVNPLPISTLPNEISACEGQSVTLSTGSSANALWNTGEFTASIVIDDAGIYTVNLELNGCFTNDSVEVNFNSTPSFTPPADFTLCEDSIQVIYLPSLGFTWLWEGVFVSDSVVVNASGIYILEAIDLSSGCGASASLDVTLGLRPQVSLPAFSQLCLGSTAALDGRAPNADDYLWNTGDTLAQISTELPGYFELLASNACGTTTVSTQVIEALCECPLLVPNAFTPDNDNLNEVFKPILGCEVETYLFEVFDRWGELVFSSKEPSEGWNGAARSNSHYAQNEVYVWKVTYSVILFDRLFTVERIGHVSLLR